MGTIDLNLLPMFVAVADTKSFSSAARRLGVPKSTISRGIAAIEASLGSRLFHRSTRQVSLSTAGAALYDRVAGSLVALQQAVAELPDQATQPSGTLRIAAPNDLGTTLLADMMARFAQRYPKIEVDIRLSSAMVDLVAEGIDVAVRISSKPLKDSQLAAYNMGNVVLGIYGAPNYLARHGTAKSVEELAAHAWVVFRQGPVIRLECPGGQVNVKAKGQLMCDDMLFAREMATAGVGLAILPVYLAHEYVVAGRLSRVLPKHKVNSGNLWLVCPDAKHMPRKVLVFREFLTEQLRLIAAINV